jgi:hypothetical protein
MNIAFTAQMPRLRARQLHRTSCQCGRVKFLNFSRMHVLLTYDFSLRLQISVFLHSSVLQVVPGPRIDPNKKSNKAERLAQDKTPTPGFGPAKDPSDLPTPDPNLITTWWPEAKPKDSDQQDKSRQQTMEKAGNDNEKPIWAQGTCVPCSSSSHQKKQQQQQQSTPTIKVQTRAGGLEVPIDECEVSEGIKEKASELKDSIIEKVKLMKEAVGESLTSTVETMSRGPNVVPPVFRTLDPVAAAARLLEDLHFVRGAAGEAAPPDKPKRELYDPDVPGKQGYMGLWGIH